VCCPSILKVGGRSWTCLPPECGGSRFAHSPTAAAVCARGLWVYREARLFAHRSRCMCTRSRGVVRVCVCVLLRSKFSKCNIQFCAPRLSSKPHNGGRAQILKHTSPPPVHPAVPKIGESTTSRTWPWSTSQTKPQLHGKLCSAPTNHTPVCWDLRSPHSWVGPTEVLQARALRSEKMYYFTEDAHG
jgi:hypothetical protein